MTPEESEPTPLKIPDAFRKQLEGKQAKERARILACVYRLGDNWRHPGLHTHKMQGHEGVYEAYVDRSNRVTFHWDGDTIVLRRNCSHDILGKP